MSAERLTSFWVSSSSWRMPLRVSSSTWASTRARTRASASGDSRDCLRLFHVLLMMLLSTGLGRLRAAFAVFTPTLLGMRHGIAVIRTVQRFTEQRDDAGRGRVQPEQHVQARVRARDRELT